MTEPLYYSQNREDRWIAENLGHLLPANGFYVDIGCGHPFITSNTAFLRDRKWQGLAIDGNFAWAKDWEDIPAFQCVVISVHQQVHFFEDPENPYCSRIDGRGSWRVSLDIEEFLGFHSVGKFDFLSIDTEGTELEILKSFDFKKHDPSIVIVEYNAAHLPLIEPEQSPIPFFMDDAGYNLEAVFPPVNMIFVRK